MQPDPELVERFRQVLASKPKGSRSGYALGYTAAAIREAADHHTNSCAGCSTCDHLSRMLAFALAYELTEASPELLRQIHGMEDEGE